MIKTITKQTVDNLTLETAQEYKDWVESDDSSVMYSMTPDVLDMLLDKLNELYPELDNEPIAADMQPIRRCSV